MLHIYKASAGSGKTYKLTQEYLRLLLGYRDPDTKRWRLRAKADGANRHILAITFTNKATEEMIKRIISELALLAGRRDNMKPDAEAKRSPYLDYFTKLFGVDAPTLQALASDTLDELLADFVFFNVSTIDSFFQNVLRIFAREIEMPDNFEVELDNNHAITVGVNEIFSSINTDSERDPAKRRETERLKRWMTRYMERMFDQGKALNIFSRSSSLFNDLVSTFGRLMDEDFKIHSSLIEKYINRPELITAFEEKLNSRLAITKKRLQTAAARLTQYGDYAMVNHHVRSCVDAWAAGNMRDPSNSVAKAISGTPKERYKADFARAQRYTPDLEAAVIDVCSMGMKLKEIQAETTAITAALSPLGLLGCLIHHINEYCKENNLILLSETNSLLTDIINDDDTPFVYERLGYYLRNFLIDEFQDTSKMQWKNLRPLILESLGYDNEDLIIGDEKQCIYRFRNSDPQLLGSTVENDIADVFGDSAVSIEGNKISENNNWRSSEEVVRFNNTIFHYIAMAIGDRMTFANVIQQIDPKRRKIDGHVSLFIEPQPEKGADKKGSKQPDDALEADDEPDSDDPYALKIVINEVDRFLSSGYRPEDIAILVRTHREGQSVIDTLLAVHERDDWPHGRLAVTSADSVSISASPAVKMIVEILRLTQIPQIVATRRPSSDQTQHEINPVYRRVRLLYCFEYYLHKPITEPDGSTRQATSDEALALALKAISDDEQLSKTEMEALSGKTKEIRELLSFADAVAAETADSVSAADSESADAAALQALNPDAPNAAAGRRAAMSPKKIVCDTLSSIVDRIISRYIHPDTLARDAVFITAFQDLVLDFCAQGSADIRSFLQWWDRKGRRTGLATTDETKAIKVMTIHQSKGLEFPCVIIPYANWELVKYSTPNQPSSHWYTVDKGYFSEFGEDLVPPLLPLEFKKELLDIPLFRDETAIVRRQALVDSINLAYVAFTRAVNELTVIAPHKTITSGENLREFLLQAVKKASPETIDADETLDAGSREWLTPLSPLFSGELELGAPTSRAETEAPKAVESPWACYAYDPQVNDSVTTVSKSNCDYFNFDNPRHRGNFLHAVMSRVKRREDLPAALRRAAYRAHLSDSQTAECETLLSAAIADKRVDPWFEGYHRVLTENPVATPDATRRPDRIVWTADGHVDIIDFKFGDRSRLNDREHSDYVDQVADYMRLLRQAGHTRVRGFLWFVTDSIIEPINP